MWTQSIKTIKVTSDHTKKQPDQVAIEQTVSLSINESYHRTFYCIPGMVKELITGYLHSEEIIHNFSDIKDISIGTTQVEATLKVKERVPIEKEAILKKMHRETIFKLTAYFQEKAILYKDTAVSESVGLANETEFIHFSEDINSQNAFYKTLGAYLQSESTDDLFLFTSSKIDYALLLGIKNTPISIVVSRTAPTAKAIQYAETNDLCLIGFARGPKFKIYTHSHRISV